MAPWPRSRHNANMAEDPHFAAREDPHFTVKIESDPLDEHRFRWEVHEGDQIHLRSPHSYMTRREAESEAARALEKFTMDRQVRRAR
jgi:hypothetical protein